MNDSEIKQILTNAKTIAMIGVNSLKKKRRSKEFEKKTCNNSYEIYAGFWL
tara:strand:- start:202 stop:354 length:153 start_codon:yes stop_codon:yes gene_type:complete